MLYNNFCPAAGLVDQTPQILDNFNDYRPFV